MKNAITEIEARIETLTANEPLQRAQGQESAADSSRATAADLQTALAVLKDHTSEDGFISFSAALTAAKSGKRIARQSWLGKDRWVAIGEGTADLPAEEFWNPHTRALAEGNGGTADVLPYLIFTSGDGRIQMGWFASQADLLANDWTVLPD